MKSRETTKTRTPRLISWFRVFVAILTFALATPGLALACPMCFGQNDSPLANAMNLGILAMLIVVVGVLAAFASFFIYLMRRAKMATPEVARQSEELAR